MKALLEFIELGGVVMIPIIALGVVALAVFLERLWSLRLGRLVPGDFVALIYRKLSEGRSAEARTLCEGNRSPMSAVLAAGLKRAGRPRQVIKESLEEVGRLEVVHLGKFVEVLGTIAAVEPLLGLLGTVFGMIEVFRSVVAESGGGAVNPATLADGIWAALITTAAGLSVAIPTFIGYKFLISRVDRAAVEMEEVSLELLERMSAEPEGQAP